MKFNFKFQLTFLDRAIMGKPTRDFEIDLFQDDTKRTSITRYKYTLPYMYDFSISFVSS